MFYCTVIVEKWDLYYDTILDNRNHDEKWKCSQMMLQRLVQKK